ncbi:MAG: SET domain-containing protein [Patescibacteria group bacterium]|nr:SET domain-containing protein [Patescibacteria group bacterium]
MLKVKTKLQMSHIHGIGLFADQFIPKGTITWEYDPHFDISYTEQELKKLPKWTKEQFLKYSYFDEKIKKYILCADDQRFINHSIDPNILSTPNFDKAGKDIQPGEELVCNYKDYESDWFERRGIDEKDFTYIVKGK